jgi:cellulose biosynthesis protein BcsQ
MSLQLSKSRDSFDVILIDCAPGISVLTEVSIRLADMIIIPTIADFLSTFGLQTFCATLTERGVISAGKRTQKRPHVLITRRRQVRIQDETATKLRNEASAPKPSFELFKTEIPEAVKVADALGQINKFPIFTQKWGPTVVPLLSDLVREIGDSLNVHRA